MAENHENENSPRNETNISETSTPAEMTSPQLHSEQDQLPQQEQVTQQSQDQMTQDDQSQAQVLQDFPQQNVTQISQQAQGQIVQDYLRPYQAQQQYQGQIRQGNPQQAQVQMHQVQPGYPAYIQQAPQAFQNNPTFSQFSEKMPPQGLPAYDPYSSSQSPQGYPEYGGYPPQNWGPHNEQAQGAHGQIQGYHTQDQYGQPNQAYLQQGYPAYDQNGYPQQGYPIYAALDPNAQQNYQETSAPVTIQYKFYQPTEEQLEDLKGRLRNKYRANMPYDWLGQIDNQWYSSWMMKQGNFVAFRLGLACYAYYCWSKFHGLVFGDHWNSYFETLLDSTTPTRFIFVWISLFVVMFATGGNALLSGLQMILSKEKFAKLTAFRLGVKFTGNLRAWLLFKINSFYDAAPVMACMPIVLHLVPSSLFQANFNLPLGPSISLPLLVLMDWWMTKRTRFDSTNVRRYNYVTIIILTAFSFLWIVFHLLVVRQLLAFHARSYFGADLAPIALFYWSYAVIVTVGVDVMFNFCRFKSNYLLMNHFKQLSSKDVNAIASEYEEYYTKKKEEVQARIEAENAEALAEWTRRMNENGFNADGTVYTATPAEDATEGGIGEQERIDSTTIDN